MTQIATVNIVKSFNNQITGIHSFPETPDGNDDAKKIFIALIEEHVQAELTDDDIEFILYEGYWEDNNGLVISLVHSVQP